MTVFAQPCHWAFFISYIIYNWPRWSHIFWTYILSPQKVKVKHMFICKKKEKKKSKPITHGLFFSSILLHPIRLLANWKKRLILSKIQTKFQISQLPLVYMMEFISLLHSDLLPENCHWKKKRLREKYHQAAFQPNIPVPTVPEFKIRYFPNQQPRGTVTQGAAFPCMTVRILVQKKILTIM